MLQIWFDFWLARTAEPRWFEVNLPIAFPWRAEENLVVVCFAVPHHNRDMLVPVEESRSSLAFRISELQLFWWCNPKSIIARKMRDTERVAQLRAVRSTREIEALRIGPF